MPIGWINDGVGSKVTRARPSLSNSPGWIGQNEPSAIGQEAEPIPVTRELIPVLWMEWRTAGDERVCPVCSPLDGLRWRSGEGPMPPLHDFCRCLRLLVAVEWVDPWR